MLLNNYIDHLFIESGVLHEPINSNITESSLEHRRSCSVCTSGTRKTYLGTSRNKGYAENRFIERNHRAEKGRGSHGIRGIVRCSNKIWRYYPPHGKSERRGQKKHGLSKVHSSDLINVNFQNPTSREFENQPKSKLELVKSLGFSSQRVSEFETLANNKDVVEQVKAEARENDDLPTRSRVLQLVKEKKKAEQPLKINRQEIKKIVNAVVNASNVPTNSELLKSWVNDMQDDEEINFNLMMIDDAIEKFQVIKAFVTKNRR